MKKLKLIIREKGRYVEIPGIPPFRSPAKVDVSKVKISILIQSLHSCGVTDYELVSTNKQGETITYNKNDFELPEKKPDNSKIENRLERLEDLLLTLLSKNKGQKTNNSEQITNRLSRIERMLKSGKVVSSTDYINQPVVEEMEDQFIPTIDIENMKSSGKAVNVVSKTSKKDIDDAVDLLSSLTNGGKK